MTPNTTQKAVIIALYTNEASNYGERLLTYKRLWDETKNHTIPALKRAVRQLIRAKLVEHSPAVDDEGRPCGSGFKLTAEGDRVAEGYEETKDYR